VDGQWIKSYGWSIKQLHFLLILQKMKTCLIDDNAISQSKRLSEYAS
jgi:hypothetical protein